jgi:hypothetical protein
VGVVLAILQKKLKKSTKIILIFQKGAFFIKKKKIKDTLYTSATCAPSATTM